MEMREESFPVRNQDCCLIRCRQLTRPAGGGSSWLKPAESPLTGLCPLQPPAPHWAELLQAGLADPAGISPRRFSVSVPRSTPNSGCPQYPQMPLGLLTSCHPHNPTQAPQHASPDLPRPSGLPSSNLGCWVSTFLLRVVRGSAVSGARGTVLDMQTLPAESEPAFTQDCQETHSRGAELWLPPARAGRCQVSSVPYGPSTALSLQGTLRTE